MVKRTRKSDGIRVTRSSKACRYDAGSEHQAPAADMELQIRLLEAQATLERERGKNAKENANLANAQANLEREKRATAGQNNPTLAIMDSFLQASSLKADASALKVDAAADQAKVAAIATSIQDEKNAEKLGILRATVREIMQPKELDLAALDKEVTFQMSLGLGSSQCNESDASEYLKLTGIDVEKYAAAFPLQAKIPISKAVLDEISQGDASAESVFRASVSEERDTFDDLANMVLEWRHGDKTLIATHQTEDGKRERGESKVPAFWQPLIDAMNRLCYLAGWANAVRTCPQSWATEDVAEGHWFLKKNYKPDIAIFKGALPVSVGEFKASKIGIQKGLAQCAKYISDGRWLPLCMGRMPFVFVFSITGVKFSVSVIKRPGDSAREFHIPKANGAYTVTFDRQREDSFVKVIMLMIDVLRVSRFLGELIAGDELANHCGVRYMGLATGPTYFRLSTSPNLAFRWEKGSSPYVEKWLDTKSLPLIYEVARCQRANTWPASLIRPLAPSDPRNAIEPIPSTNAAFCHLARLEPVGCHRAVKAKTIKCIRSLLRDLQSALAFLHALRFCHCDVARRNVVRRHYWTEGYLLVDIDSAEKFKHGGGILLLNCRHARVWRNGGIYRPCDDVAQLLEIVREMAEDLPQAVKDKEETFLKQLKSDITFVCGQIDANVDGVFLTTANDLQIDADSRIHLNIPAPVEKKRANTRNSPAGKMRGR